MLSEANVRNMLSAISRGNHVLNERAKLFKIAKTNCPDCGFDPIRKESTNPDCDTCEGKGMVEVLSYNEIPVSIETEKDTQYRFTNAGKITEGEILLTIDSKEISEVLNLDKSHDLSTHQGIKKFVEQYDHITWHNAKYKMASFEASYLQGIFYEISMKMKLEEW